MVQGGSAPSGERNQNDVYRFRRQHGMQKAQSLPSKVKGRPKRKKKKIIAQDLKSETGRARRNIQ